MKPTIVANGVKLPKVMRDHVVRRLRFALDRTQQSINAIIVRITDHNGPKGGIDKQCQIQLRIPGLPPVIVTGKAASIAEAVDVTVHRAAQVITRHLERAKQIRHARFKAPLVAESA
ncbi:HPF/RaiA family ribosome-associated protein [Noviherbaspirillum aerium]|uniref:HPF/RaiA family ribosome-associated protein n=1 Tax=Noviherbaspirillum aerium TaxID=2588497 RepID=UPI00124E1561|nr:HPF/RaiA family ribosome-associated protein [Noviherbaspirillum aerium]